MSSDTLKLVTDDLDALPLAEADQRIREQIAHHQQQIEILSAARSRRILAERESGRSVVQIAADLGVHRQVVYELIWKAERGQSKA